MTDDDRTEAAIAFHQELALINHQHSQPKGLALHYCAECSNEIPLARRQAVPGVTLCIDCKTAEEIEGKRWGT